MRNGRLKGGGVRALVRFLFRDRRAAPAPACAGRDLLRWRRPPVADYSAAIDSVLSAFEPRVHAVARERAAAPGLLAELLRHPPARRTLLVRNSARFRSLVLCELLLRAAREESGPAAEDRERSARLALDALSRLDAEVYGEGVIEDFRARAWGIVGEARRLAGDLDGAGAALVEALRRLRRGTGDLFERAQVLDQVSALRRQQGRWGDALRLLGRSASAYRRLGEWQLEARSLVESGCAWWERGEPGRALVLLRQAERRLDAGLDPELAARLRRHLADCLAATGRPLEAQAVLARTRRFGVRPAARRRLAGRPADGFLRLVER